MRKKPELLAPAGNMEKLRYALHYGADAVYCAGKRFGLRARADNFEDEELKEAVAYTHGLEKRIYVTLNFIPHNRDFDGLEDYILFLDKIGVDAVLVADPGIFRLVRQTAPDLPVTISTQANNTNSGSVAFWHELGAGRIVLARECSGAEIEEICSQAPEGMEIEVFVHGAMCISYSGRCLLSHYLTGRNSNQGDCAQPCRWKYHLVEDTRQEEVFHMEDGDGGSFIFNSKDLCLAKKIPELTAAGVRSFKIEGRMKSAFYVATVVSVYRRIIDACWDDPSFQVPDEWVTELTKVSHRNYTEAFYGGTTSGDDQNYGTSSYTREYDFSGVVLGYEPETGMALIEQRNKLSVGDCLEFISPSSEVLYQNCVVEMLYNEAGEPINSAPHAQMICRFKTGFPVKKMDIVRKAKASVQND